ncbi:hypothetical protein GCM10007094_38200 [Pseudovibrio japonicus]|uniref:Uncharacterized protein n=1 Tax=Pseudovibrio japonicus TaxID=366534 RepID=A0ABQ3EL29_9HYPH|nr:hypothetical protein [Pseudovibrio japonicus]GHB45167.1 hypothetical protein GCM10007094_38200 [Pseudovibrio japonicus]
MLSLLKGLLQRDVGNASVEFGLISGLVALTILAMVSAPKLSDADFLPASEKAQPSETKPKLQLWELVKPTN